MTSPTLQTIHDKLEVVQSDVKDLKKNKLDKETNSLILKAIDEKIDGIIRDIENINGYGKWLVLLVMGAVILAVLKVVGLK
jgi:hypothetical protein